MHSSQWRGSCLLEDCSATGWGTIYHTLSEIRPLGLYARIAGVERGRNGIKFSVIGAMKDQFDGELDFYFRVVGIWISEATRQIVLLKSDASIGSTIMSKEDDQIFANISNAN